MTNSTSLGREGVSLYRQIAGLLRRKLEQGVWKMGDQLPTLEALMLEYGVSRVTMRQAVALLEYVDWRIRSAAHGGNCRHLTADHCLLSVPPGGNGHARLGTVFRPWPTNAGADRGRSVRVSHKAQPVWTRLRIGAIIFPIGCKGMTALRYLL